MSKNIVSYWSKPSEQQKEIRTRNPVTKCVVCGEPDKRLLSCDACGESICFECAIACGTLKITKGGFVDADDIVLCKNCGSFS